MKVEFGSGIGMYRNNLTPGVNKNPKETAETAKTDIAEFARSASPALGKVYAGAKTSIVSGVTATADPARIEALKQSVREGTYHVSTDDIVRSILGE